MKLNKIEWGILIFNILNLIVFTFLYLGRKNYEFLMYIGVVFFFIVLISILHLNYKFSNGVLIGLTVWAFMHMAGGYFLINNEVLYAYQLIPKILRFDQFVHMWGFGFATLFSYHILKPSLKNGTKNKLSILVLLLFIGMGIGALNEIVEFIAVLLIKDTGVGGYTNTMWDMVFNTIGALIAIIYIKLKRR